MSTEQPAQPGWAAYPHDLGASAKGRRSKASRDDGTPCDRARAT